VVIAIGAAEAVAIAAAVNRVNKYRLNISYSPWTFSL